MNYFLSALFLCGQLCLFSSHPLESEFLWPQIEILEKEGILRSVIQERICEIRALNEQWRPLIQEQPMRYPEFFSKFSSTLQEGKLTLEQEGTGAAYVLYDAHDHPQFVIKPSDENVFCLHNPKRFASPFLEPRAKEHIPLYRGAQTDALCYELAKLCHLEHVTPKAVLSLISRSEFFHICKEFRALFSKEEKLCSVQEYLTGTLPLREVLEDFFAGGLLEEELLGRFDQEDFEDITLFLWLTFDNDAHTDNFRVYPKKMDASGEIVYGIQKIDNSLSLPEKSNGFSSALMYFPNSFLPISSNVREKVRSLPMQEIEKVMERFGLTSSFPAFKDRIFVLNKLLERQELSYYECSIRLSLLDKPSGHELALGDEPLEHLEYLARDLIKIKSPFRGSEALF